MTGRALMWLAPLITVVILAGLYGRGILRDTSSPTPPIAGEVNCGPQTDPCFAGDRQHGVALSFPQSVPLMVAFPVQVQVFGTPAASVRINFQMRSMDMGVNELQLRESEPGIWRGQATLPICTSGRADWIAQVAVETDSTVRRARFGFTAGAQ